MATIALDISDDFGATFAAIRRIPALTDGDTDRLKRLVARLTREIRTAESAAKRASMAASPRRRVGASLGGSLERLALIAKVGG